MTKRNSTSIAPIKQPKRKVHGVGFNSGGKHPIRENNKKTKLYSVWTAMIQRCYSEVNQRKHPTYKDCTVAEIWHDFQNFAEWYVNHPLSNEKYHLDKDLLVIGNKVYSPEFCTLVPRAINNLTLGDNSRKGNLPQGVYFDKDAKKYKSQIQINGKVVNLGRYNSIDDASEIYIKTKERHVKNTALHWANRIEWDVFKNLMQWSVSK